MHPVVERTRGGGGASSSAAAHQAGHVAAQSAAVRQRNSGRAPQQLGVPIDIAAFAEDDAAPEHDDNRADDLGLCG